jgi:hypothetical protein
MPGAERVFAAAAVAESIKATFRYAESGELPEVRHPLGTLFKDFVEQLRG